MVLSKIIIASYVLQMFIVLMQYLKFESFYLNDVENLGLNTGMTQNSSGGIRYWGSFGEALVLSTYLTSIGIGVSVYMISVFKKNIVTYILILTIIFTIYLTGSRAGLSIYIIMICVYLFLSKVSSLFMIIGLILFVLIGSQFSILSFIGASENLSRFAQLQGNDARYVLWTKGFNIIYNNPIFGSSIGCLNYSLKEHNLLPGFVSTINASGHVENSFLTILFSVGIAGFLFFLGLVFYPLTLIRRYHLMTLSDMSLYKAITKAYTYSYISLLLCMFTEPSVGVHMRSSMVFIIMNALVCCLAKIYVIDNDMLNSKSSIKSLIVSS
ncbi:O-antigen ligase family protein [Spirosoma utsteinense]|uniref:O-antigen ligase n=1 Tax=Spirosoma utsteinense TaxID=2585773 RepID=A0ABR6WFJ5_9BACT|nr:O-antigen ligase family protein [Spirosoma utsteinense]MBC3795329.1 O-antigen ligase [Spirosoma utsteinense]